MSDNFSILTDTERAVVETITMRMHTDEAIAYLKDCGINMVKCSYYRHKKKVEAMKWQRLIHAANLFTHHQVKGKEGTKFVKRPKTFK